MLPELFSGFFIDDDDDDETEFENGRNNSAHNDDPTSYVPADRSRKWFLRNGYRLGLHDYGNSHEILQNRAALAYFEADYVTAMDIYLYMLKNEMYRGSSRFVLIDSIIRCGLKTAPINGPQLLSLLHKMHLLVASYDEQLQYWALSLKVYSAAAGSGDIDYLRNAILLCASIDLPEFWISLAKSTPDFCANLRVGSICRAICLIENSPYSQEQGFSAYNAELLKQMLLRGPCDESKLAEAEAAVCNDIVKGGKRPPETGNPEFSKGILKSRETQKAMIKEFVHRFDWLFADMNDDVVNALLKLF